MRKAYGQVGIGRTVRHPAYYHFDDWEKTDLILAIDVAMNRLGPKLVDAEFVTVAEQLSREDQLKMVERLGKIREGLV